MSSEACIHLQDRPIAGRVTSLGEHSGKMISIDSVVTGQGGYSQYRFVLFVEDNRLWELSRLFTDIGQSLAALAPSGEQSGLDRKATP